jgi:hypothetical protein
MADVQKVEAAIGEGDLVTRRPPLGDPLLQSFTITDFVFVQGCSSRLLRDLRDLCGKSSPRNTAESAKETAKPKA